VKPWPETGNSCRVEKFMIQPLGKKWGGERFLNGSRILENEESAKEGTVESGKKDTLTSSILKHNPDSAL